MSAFQPTRFGKYLLLEKLATGGMAQLYRGKIIGVQGFEKYIAIKMILPHLAEDRDLVDSFIHEAKLAALLNHQNIVQIYDFGSMEGSYFITMEYLFGKDLRVVSNKSRDTGAAMGLEQALYVTSRICAGLDYAHRLKDFQGNPLHIIHRDISPQNILITYEGDVKIVDFGIAKAATRSTITQVGMIKGKVAYMSPEQAAGKAIDHRSDIFSAGILLYEMIAGTRMFKGDDTIQILAKVRDAEFAPLRTLMGDLPDKLHQILDRALARDPDERYASCGEMQADVEECIFRLAFRPTARGLADYMKQLFREEIAAESVLLGESAGVGAGREPEPPGVEKAPELPPQPAARPPEEGAAGRKGKKTAALFAGIAAVLLAGGVAVGLWVRKAPSPPADNAAKASPPAAPPVSGAAAPATGSSPPSGAGEDKAAADRQRAEGMRRQAAALADSDAAGARILLRQAVALEPANLQGRTQLARVCVKLKDYPEAAENYRKATELDPGFPDSYFNLGYIHAVTKEYAKAEEMYERTVKLSPPYLDEALFNLASVQEKQGKRRQCVANLERAVKVNPGNQPAKNLLRKLKGRP